MPLYVLLFRRLCALTVWSVSGGRTMVFSMVFITSFHSSFNTRFSTVFSQILANRVRLAGDGQTEDRKERWLTSRRRQTLLSWEEKRETGAKKGGCLKSLISKSLVRKAQNILGDFSHAFTHLESANSWMPFLVFMSHWAVWVISAWHNPLHDHGIKH